MFLFIFKETYFVFALFCKCKSEELLTLVLSKGFVMSFQQCDHVCGYCFSVISFRKTVTLGLGRGLVVSVREALDSSLALCKLGLEPQTCGVSTEEG